MGVGHLILTQHLNLIFSKKKKKKKERKEKIEYDGKSLAESEDFSLRQI